MVKLLWGAVGERYFEAGVDRGVLYPQGGNGVAWNGLTSVQESPQGGGARPYYLDGFKYLNLAEAEEFEATLEAFSAPAEFAALDGSAEVSSGLFVTQQPRRPFGLSYRTKVGNDLSGIDHGYKIHLVYNALAAPASRQYNTLNDSPQASPLSWTITTAPSLLPGRRPSAHLVIDSRRIGKAALAILEAYLYGSEGLPARLPSPTQIINWIALMQPADGSQPWDEIDIPLTFRGQVERTSVDKINRVTNPRGRNSTSTVVLYNNYVANPSCESAAFAPYNSSLTTTQSTDHIYHGLHSTKVYSTSDGFTRLGISLGNISRPVGKTYLSVWCYIPSTCTANLLRCRFQHSTVTSYREGPFPRDQWFLLEQEITSDAAISSVMYIGFEVTNTKASTDFVYFDAAVVSDFKVPYFDGSTTFDDDLTPEWSGAVHASASRLVAPKPNSFVTPTNGLMYYSQSQDAIAMLKTSNSGATFMTSTISNIIGSEFTAVTEAWSREGKPFRARAYGVGFAGSYEDVNGVGVLRSTGVPTSGHVALNVQNTETSVPGDVYYFRTAFVEGLNYSGPYFDGHSDPFVYQDQEVDPKWTGTENNSRSSFSLITSLPERFTDGDAWMVGDELVVALEGAWRNFGAVPLLV